MSIFTTKHETTPLDYSSIPDHYRLIPYHAPTPKIDRIKGFLSRLPLPKPSPSQAPNNSPLPNTPSPDNPPNISQPSNPELQYIQAHTGLTSQDLIESIPRKPKELSQDQIQPRYEQLHQFLQTRESLPDRIDTSTQTLITQALVLFPHQSNPDTTKLDASGRRATKLLFDSLPNRADIPELISQARNLSQQHNITHIPWHLIQKSLIGQQTYHQKITLLRQANIPTEGLSAIQVNQKIKDLNASPSPQTIPTPNIRLPQFKEQLKRITQYFQHRHPALTRIALAGAMAFTLNSCTPRHNYESEIPTNPNNHTQIIPSSTQYMDILLAQNSHYQPHAELPASPHTTTVETNAPLTPTQFSNLDLDPARMSRIEDRVSSLETQIDNRISILESQVIELTQTPEVAPSPPTPTPVPIVFNIQPITRPDAPPLSIPIPEITPPAIHNAEQLPQSYTVQKGDCLSAIAVKYYGQGNGHLYTLIAQTNHIPNPDLIYPGQTLSIPTLN